MGISNRGVSRGRNSAVTRSFWVEEEDSWLAGSAEMGASVSWLSGLLWAKKEIRILILGLVCPLFLSSFSKSQVLFWNSTDL